MRRGSPTVARTGRGHGGREGPSRTGRDGVEAARALPSRAPSDELRASVGNVVGAFPAVGPVERGQPLVPTGATFRLGLIPPRCAAFTEGGLRGVHPGPSRVFGLRVTRPDAEGTGRTRGGDGHAGHARAVFAAAAGGRVLLTVVRRAATCLMSGQRASATGGTDRRRIRTTAGSQGAGAARRVRRAGPLQRWGGRGSRRRSRRVR